MRLIESIIIHCSYTYPDMDIGVPEIRDWHVNGNGWSDIGYNYVIRRDGQIEPGRDRDGDGDVIEEVGAHTKGFNANSIGVCLIGGKHSSNVPIFNFTRAQMNSLDALVMELWEDIPTIRSIRGHNDFTDAKLCPAFNVRVWFPDAQWARARTESADSGLVSSPYLPTDPSASDETTGNK